DREAPSTPPRREPPQPHASRHPRSRWQPSPAPLPNNPQVWERYKPISSALSQACHPERSKPIRKANRFAESKDPYQLLCARGPTGSSHDTFTSTKTRKKG